MEKALTFQALKPVCVELSRVALAYKSGRITTKEVVKAQDDLRNVLAKAVQSQSGAIDKSLADYVFFPLSHVLRQHQTLPARALESCLGCVAILLESAWRVDLDAKLGIQLLILLTVLADSNTSTKGVQTRSEELQIVTFRCLAALLKSLSSTADGRHELLQTSTIPYLGKAVYEILEGAKHGPSQDVQLSALTALSFFLDAVDDDEAISISFLPGIVSASQKVLSPSVSSPRGYKVVVECLGMLSTLLHRLFNDGAVHDLAKKPSFDSGNKPTEGRLDRGWFDMSVEKINLVLITLVKLRFHDRAEVQDALHEFCIVLIKNCRGAFANSVAILLETLVTVAASRSEGQQEQMLMHLVCESNDLSQHLQESLHKWIVALPRVVQGNDEIKKQRIVDQISLSYRVLLASGINLSELGKLLTIHFRDAVASIMGVSTARSIENDYAPESLEKALSSSSAIGNLSSKPTLYAHGSQVSTLNSLGILANQLALQEHGRLLLQQFVQSTFASDDLLQISNFWTSVQMVKAILKRESDFDAFLAVPADEEEGLETDLQDLYSLSLDIITNTTRKQHSWPIQALALETIALQAGFWKSDFKNELVDVLFPVLQCMGSPNENVRNNSIQCLNTIASACGYRDVSDLIVANVDYLVNSVALHINSFEISAQAPQVLLMIVKLTGPQLLPYLDDTVESMFSALEMYHGYPKLAESIFTTLMAIAQEGAKTDLLAIEYSENNVRKAITREPIAIEKVATLIKHAKTTHQNGNIADFSNSLGRRDSTSWKEELDGIEKENQFAKLSGTPVEQVDASTQQQEKIENVDTPPVPKTYSILLKISELTQHYLTSASPSFRASLLSLLNTTFPALAKHENSFLPLINTLWPPVISRLEDSEALVVAHALETISCLCQWAGGFVRSRIIRLWPELMMLGRKRASLKDHNHRTHSISRERKGHTSGDYATGGFPPAPILTTSLPGTQYVDAPTRTIRQSLLNCLLVIVDLVEIDEDMFDDILELLNPYLAEDRVRNVLIKHNADAVWLALLRNSSQ